LNSDSKAFGSKEIYEKIELYYDTGDLVKEIDSNLYFIGRKDNQVKLRGYRIELDEIDSWIMRFTGAKSVSIIHTDAIHSFIEDPALNEEGLKAFLESNLERYKVPAYLHTTSALPRNSNQKVDRLALKKVIDEKGKTNITV
jgi:acyl-coenzyme A synthetase/AMP-(fatty) acid ligase